MSIERAFGKTDSSSFVSLLDNVTKASVRQNNGHVRHPEVVSRLWGLDISRCPDPFWNPKPCPGSVGTWLICTDSKFFFLGALAVAEASKTVGWNSWLVVWGETRTYHVGTYCYHTHTEFRIFHSIQFTDTGNKTGPFGCKANDQGRPHITSHSPHI